jgi:hypothetical protein
MTVSAREAPVDETFVPCLAADPFSLAEANINPVTGLSTDYLNHFNEAIMLLEMLPSMPECREDFAAWRPVDYHEHFSRSRLAQRELAVAAYDLASPRVRRQFDGLCGGMKSAVTAAQALLAAGPEADDSARIAEEATIVLKQLVACASAVIHGHELIGSPASIQESQAAVDAILGP